MPVDNLI